MTIQVSLGIAAGLLELAASFIYIGSILKGHTKPDRVTWWILAFVSAIITASYYASGARETIWLPLAYTATNIAIAILSVRFGYGPILLSRLDRVCLLGGLVSVIAWLLLNSPQTALYMSIGVDFIALVPTAYKAYRRPLTESAISWSIAVFASILNLLAVEQWTFALSLYPAYLLIINAAIAYATVRRKV